MTDPLRVQLARVNLAILNAEAWARRYPGSNPSGYIEDLIAERAAIEVRIENRRIVAGFEIVLLDWWRRVA